MVVHGSNELTAPQQHYTWTALSADFDFTKQMKSLLANQEQETCMITDKSKGVL
jgi:hypothetical protein